MKHSAPYSGIVFFAFLALILSLGFQTCGRADDNGAAKPAVEETSQPEAAAELTPAAKKLESLEKEWRAVILRLALLRKEFAEATPERREAINLEWNTLLAEGEKLRTDYLATAEKVYIEKKGKDPNLAMLFVKQLYDQVQSQSRTTPKIENYEEAARIAQMMHDVGCENIQFYNLAAIAFNAVSKFDLAAEYLEKAEEKEALTDTTKEIAMTIGYHQKFWPEELAARKDDAKANLPHVLLKTSKGDIEFELFEDDAPNTVANFISLVDKGYYNGLTFHRVLPGFMAQGGCNKGDGSGGPGYAIDCETDLPGARNHYRGSLSMAHAGPNTGGAQFFITFVPTAHLDGVHTVFGRVVNGIEVLSKLQRRDPESSNPPEPDRIIEAEVLSRRDHPYVPKTHPRP